MTDEFVGLETYLSNKPKPAPFSSQPYGIELWEEYGIDPTVFIGSKWQLYDDWYRIDSWNPETQTYWVVPIEKDEDHADMG